MTSYSDRKKSRFFQNLDCEYFPCHKIENPDDFNCMFCYCPLYALGDRCGGNFGYTESGIKTCINCSLPHTDDGYEHIISKLPEVLELARKKTDDGYGG